MTGWKRICCAVDFEEPSRVAMVQAAELARRLEAELTLIHVAEPPREAVGDWLAPEQAPGKAKVRDDAETLASWREEAAKRAGRPVRSRLCAGPAAAEILGHAREERCDLVVVGTHGRTGVPRLVLGSVAERVARQAWCPVLVVRDHGGLERQEVEEELAQYR